MNTNQTTTDTSRQTLLDSKNLFISCVIPVYNEAAGIMEFITALDKHLHILSNQYEIIIVDDGSTDNTAEILNSCLDKLPLKILSLSRNFGKETALTAGIEACNGDVAIIMDSDFQHPLNLIPQFIQYWALGYDMVYGIRINRSNENFLKRWLTAIFYRAMQWITQVNIVPNAGDFRLLDRKVIDSLNHCQERGRFMKGLYAWVGFKNIGIPFNAPARIAGRSSWHLRNLTELAITGITSFSNTPLRIWSLVGLLIACCSFGCAVYIVTSTLLSDNILPDGYPTIMITMIFFGGIQLFSIGVLGEYIARIFNEVKRRPQYIIDKKLGFEDAKDDMPG